MAGSRRSAERVLRGQHLAMAPTKAEKSQRRICFSQGCATPLVLTTEKKTHTYRWPHLHRLWQEEDRRVDPTPCSFRKDGEMKRREGCWLDGWSPSPLLPLSCFMMLVSFCAMLIRSTGEEEWRLSNPPFLPQIWYSWSKTDTCPHLCVFLCAYLNSWCHNDPSLTLHIYGII